MAVQNINGVNTFLLPESANITKIYGTSGKICFKFVKKPKFG